MNLPTLSGRYQLLLSVARVVKKEPIRILSINERDKKNNKEFTHYLNNNVSRQ